MIRTPFASLAAVLALSGVANAKSTMVEVGKDAMISQFGVESDALKDIEVYDAQGNGVGDVEEVLGPDEDTPNHLLVDFGKHDGGNYPDRHDIVVPIEDFSYSDDQLTIGISPDAVKRLPTHGND